MPVALMGCTRVSLVRSVVRRRRATRELFRPQGGPSSTLLASSATLRIRIVSVEQTFRLVAQRLEVEYGI